MLVADTNALRHPGLEQYLQASRDHSIVLSDWTLTEMRKTSALSTSRDSLRIVNKFSDQCYTLKRTDLLLDIEVRGSDEITSLIDYRATIELANLARLLRQIPPATGLAGHLRVLERDAAMIMTRLRGEVAKWEEQLADAASVFDTKELSLFRKNSVLNVPESTMRKVLDLLLHTTRDFMVRNQHKGGTAPLKVSDAMSMFGFRYSLCTLIYTLSWIRTGSQKGRSVEKRVNDVIDLQVAAIGTFFNGVLSGDQGLQGVSRGARSLLRTWGAYVGDDWSPLATDA